MKERIFIVLLVILAIIFVPVGIASLYNHSYKSLYDLWGMGIVLIAVGIIIGFIAFLIGSIGVLMFLIGCFNIPNEIAKIRNWFKYGKYQL